MDSESITGNNFHFCQVTHREDDVTKSIQYKARRDVGPMRYFYIDVGISRKYPPDCPQRTISGRWGQDKTLPEFQHGLSGPIDPFKTDICQLGSVFARIVQVSRQSDFLRTIFLSPQKQYEGLSMLAPITTQMTLPQPELRPTSRDAYTQLANLVASLTEDDLAQRVWYVESTPEVRKRLENGKDSPLELLRLWPCLGPYYKKA